MTERDTQSENSTRERLLETAAFLFWQVGYEATSLSRICDEAQVNAGSLYYYFPAKLDLLVAVLDWYHASIEEALLLPAWQDVDDPLERVFALLDRYRQNLLSTDFRYGCPIGNVAIEMRDPPEEVRQAMARNFVAWTSAVAECLRNAGLPAERDATELARLVLSVMEGAVMQARVHRDIAPFDASVANLRDHLAGVLERAS